ncbi:hypothetical protein ACF0H5_007380 [Mactra antiquata]
MSVEVDDKVRVATLNDKSKDSYGLPVQQSALNNLGNRVIYDSQTGGVRIPILRDLDDKYQGRKKPTECRFDIVEKVTTVIKPGSYGPDDKISKSHSDDSPLKRISLPRQQTFHSTSTAQASNSPRSKDASVLNKIGPYHWNQWVRYGSGDARDVLYRNTYCSDPENVRYRTLTLPRISTSPNNNERPWTVSGDDKPVVTKHEQGEYSKIVTIVPQQPRGTVVRFREYMKPMTYDSDARAFEVKRYSSKIPVNDHFTAAANQGLPLIKHDYRKSPRKTERPLKSENVRYTRKSTKETLFNKYMMPLYKSALNRDYSSADTFKEYLNSLQQTAKGMPSHGEMTGYRNLDSRHALDYHNKVLQSVSDVNQPELDDRMRTEREISVEIKHSRRGSRPQTKDKPHPEYALGKHPSIENLSSVHGSVVRAHSETHSVALPRSSSVADAKGIVKIPSVVSESGNELRPIPNANQNTSLVSNKEVLPEAVLDTVDENGSLCPANTPTRIN